MHAASRVLLVVLSCPLEPRSKDYLSLYRSFSLSFSLVNLESKDGWGLR